MEDTSKQEILEAIGLLADHLEEMRGKMEDMDGKMRDMDGRMKSMDGRIKNMDERITAIGSQMVTKDYLDEKLGVLRGDLVALAMKSNTKFTTLVEDLVREGSLKRSSADLVLAMEPFADPRSRLSAP